MEAIPFSGTLLSQISTRKELEVFLRGRYEREFMSQANEFMQKVVFRGNYDADFKEFLKDKGF